MINEYESKCMITKTTFLKLIKDYKLSDYLVNSNYYYDTKDQYFKAKQSALRIRTNQLLKEVTIKTKQEDFHLEQNHLISSDQYNQIKAGQYQTFHEFFPETKELQLQLIAHFTTHRYQFEFQDHIIELDHTYTGNYEDFEIEIEAKSTKIASHIMQQFLKVNQIDYQASSSKIARIKKIQS